MQTYEVKVYDGNKEWRMNGELHREDGPAFEHANGDKHWYRNGKLHREDGPAQEGVNGTKCWYINGNRHREDGPACEWANGNKEWWVNGERHREDGPAIEWENDYHYNAWYLNNLCITEEEFNRRTKPLFGTKMIVDGVEYTLG